MQREIEDVEQLQLSCTAGGSVNWSSHLENSLMLPGIVEDTHTLWLRSFTPCACTLEKPMGMEIRTHVQDIVKSSQTLKSSQKYASGGMDEWTGIVYCHEKGMHSATYNMGDLANLWLSKKKKGARESFE